MDERLVQLADAVGIALEVREDPASVDVETLIASRPDLSHLLEPLLLVPTLPPRTEIVSGAAGMPATAALPAVPGVRIIRELGRGGMGVVYEAEQEAPRRRVVVKMLEQGCVLREAQMMADALAHAPAGICQIHAVGTSEGRPYLLMQHIEGRSLAEVMRDDLAAEAGPDPTERSEFVAFTDDPTDEVATDDVASPSRARLPRPDRARIRVAAELVEGAARALHEAHEAGVIHGDVKPNNIMVKPDGQPVVIDFGVANLATDGRSYGGTPRYMAPEQRRNEAIDRRVDVFGLGATLFHLLTREVLRVETWDAEGAPSPHRLNPAVPADLAAVCRKACHPRRGSRYATALELADDIRRALAHRPTRARPPSTPRRAALLVRRHPIAAGLVAALLVAGAILAAIQWRRHHDSIDATVQATSQYARWADALARGDEPATGDDDTVRRYVDEATYAWLRQHALSPAAFADFTQRVLAEVRGEEEWVFPGGDVRVVPPVTFRVRDLTGKRRPDSPVILRLAPAETLEWRHEIEIPASGATRDLDIVLPDDVALHAPDGDAAPETWVWQVVVTDGIGRRLERRYASFAAVSPAFRDRIVAGVKTTGDAALDQVLRAAALLAQGLAEDAVRELDAPVAAGAAAGLVASRHQLLVRALAVVDPRRARHLVAAEREEIR